MRRQPLSNIDKIINEVIGNVFDEGDYVCSIDSNKLAKRIKEDVFDSKGTSFSADQEEAIIGACQETYLGCHILMRMYVCNVLQDLIPEIISEVKEQFAAEGILNDQ